MFGAGLAACSPEVVDVVEAAPVVRHDVAAFALAEPRQSPAPAIEDPTGMALAPFFAALRRTQTKAPGAVTRVLHMGDSSIGLDGLPHAIRKRMQARFGDAGPGFVLLDRYSANYRSQVVDIEAEHWDVCYIAYLCKKDGHYGLGGHVFRGKGGAWSRFKPPRQSEVGREISSIEVWYALQPGGGQLQLRVDGGSAQIIETDGEALDEAWHRVDVPRGEHVVELRAGRGGAVRAYGVVLENDGPGVVWDTVSMIGAFTKRLHGYDAEHIQAQLARRKPDLLVLNYGGNDLRRLVSGSASPERYKAEYREVLSKLRGRAPAVPCLVVSVIDHGRSGTYTVEPRHVDAMVAAQREVAFEQGCAFFDSVAAMGGAGALRKWLKTSPRLAEPDLKHLNHRGRDHMGGMMYDALMHAFASDTRRLGTR